MPSSVFRSLALVMCVLGGAAAAQAHDDVDDVLRGRTIFLHSFTPNDPLSAGGDGVGPTYNAASCVACHNQGGPGGAGGAHTNARIAGGRMQWRHDSAHIVPRLFARGGIDGDGRVLPFFGTIGDVGFGAAPVERNTPALFGAGLIDALDDAVIAAGAERTIAGHPEIHGHVVHGADGRIGRFGWKADVPDLVAFVSRACAMELGLEVPGSPQPPPRHRNQPDDLSLNDLAALIGYVQALPRPPDAAAGGIVSEGREVFDSVGCTACHSQALGDIDGLYSDLLVHDMGRALDDASNAGYYGAPSTTSSARWRTPPLWGVAASGPWLHDGRAQTLEAAIVSHGGEATRVTAAYRALRDDDRAALVAFLEALDAPHGGADAWDTAAAAGLGVAD